jgi:hypothetical protein
VSAAHPLRAWRGRVAGWLVPPRRRRPARARADLDLVGRDFAQPRARGSRWPAALPALLAGVLLAALALAALRVDLIRVRYGLGQAMQEEKDLLEQERTLRARVGSLRDPIRLARLAPRHGLARPARALELSAPPAPNRRP